MKTLTSGVIAPLKAALQFGRRHPRLKTIAMLMIVANEIRGVVTVVVYLKTFGLSLPT